MAAIFAARAGARVVVVERTSDGGRKILISGGGRCNVLPVALQPERFVTDSPPHLLRGMLRSWPLAAQRAFFETELRIPLKVEEESQKLFPVSNRARDIRDGLVTAARDAGVEFLFDTTVRSVRAADGAIDVDTSRATIRAPAAIVAAGGLSVPATGSAGDGFSIARALGHVVHTPYAALTPLRDQPPAFGTLAGISLTVRIKAKDRDREAASEGGFLFTHRGYSGPSVLDVSHVAVRSQSREPLRATLRVAWTTVTAEEWRREFTDAGAVSTRALAGRHVPQRLADALLAAAAIEPARPASQLSRADRARLVDLLTSFELPWTGDEGFAKAEVTGGGVALDEVDRHTLESRRCRGVYFCGEVLDAFGPIGGHNFAWAWATGRLAGMAAGEAAAGAPAAP